MSSAGSRANPRAGSNTPIDQAPIRRVHRSQCRVPTRLGSEYFIAKARSRARRLSTALQAASQQSHGFRFPAQSFGVNIAKTLESLPNQIVGVGRTITEGFGHPVAMRNRGGFQPALLLHHPDALR